MNPMIPSLSLPKTTKSPILYSFCFFDFATFLVPLFDRFLSLTPHGLSPDDDAALPLSAERVDVDFDFGFLVDRGLNERGHCLRD